MFADSLSDPYLFNYSGKTHDLIMANLLSQCGDPFVKSRQGNLFLLARLGTDSFQTVVGQQQGIPPSPKTPELSAEGNSVLFESSRAKPMKPVTQLKKHKKG